MINLVASAIREPAFHHSGEGRFSLSRRGSFSLVRLRISCRFFSNWGVENFQIIFTVEGKFCLK